jgi:D-beta-D-heptose 7-phosphate kinase/D-beta-D-heptose 1-phosphate adenosyltransferase
MVIGDLMLDEHVWGTVERISPEAPVLVVQVDSDADCLPGGAANVANNIRALGGEASVVGVVGEDEGGWMLREVLAGEGIDVGGVFTDDKRPTTRKTRIWASHRHQVVRIDRESKRKVSHGIVERMVDHIRRQSAGMDAILVSDYAKGVITKDTVSAAVASATDADKICVSNPKPRNISCFGGTGVITLNQSEAAAASGIDIDDLGDVERAGRKIIGMTRCRGLVITRGAHGLSAFEAGKISHIPAIETEVYDVAGAGDTVVSALTMALACGLDLASAGEIANCAGAVVVRKVGVATTTVAEISALLNTQ